MMKWIKKNKLTIGILLSLFFLYLAFRQVSLEEILLVLSETSPITIVWMVMINIGARLVVSIRWWFLLRFHHPFSFWDAFHYLNIGYFINSIIPARTGDVVKSVLIAQKNNTGKTASMSTVVIERIFDMVGLGIAFLVALIILNLPGYIKTGGYIVSGLAMAAMGSLFVLSFYQGWVTKKISRYSGNKYFLWATRKIEQLFSYSKVLQNYKIMVGVMLSTLVSWFLYVWAGYIILEDIIPGLFSWHVALLSLIIVSVSFVLPTTPGNLGVYQFACVLAFSIADMPRESAIVFSLIAQIPVYLLSIALGLISMGSEGINKKEMKQQSESVL